MKWVSLPDRIGRTILGRRSSNEHPYLHLHSGRLFLDELFPIDGTVRLDAQFTESVQTAIIFFAKHTQAIESVVEHLLLSKPGRSESFFDPVEYRDARVGDALRQLGRVEFLECKLVEFSPTLRAGSGCGAHINSIPRREGETIFLLNAGIVGTMLGVFLYVSAPTATECTHALSLRSSRQTQF